MDGFCLPFLQEENGDAEELASELAEILQEEYAIRVRLVIGSVVSGVEQLHISWNDAQNSLNNERKEFQDMIIRSRVDRKRADIFQDVFREFKKTTGRKRGGCRAGTSYFRTLPDG